MKKPFYEVVAAFIMRNEKILICQRPAHKSNALLWEFVGGKVEEGESKEMALIRECREELDAEVEVGNVFFEVYHEYPDISVHLTLFWATLIGETVTPLEHNAIQWISPCEVDNFVFCPADTAILDRIKKFGKGLKA